MIVPYKEQEDGKKKQVARMFDNIAPKYDFLNHFLSMGIDHLWRRTVLNLLKKELAKTKLNKPTILDVATGTGDLAITLRKLDPEQITGVDISVEMLRVGEQKIKKRNLQHLISLSTGDSENLQFPDGTFHIVTAAFGVRNFENLEKGISEMYRVLATNGTLCILEFSKPTAFPVKQVYNFYFRNILPLWGKLISKDNSAYTYLPDSVNAFPDGLAFQAILQNCGFKSIVQKRLSFGIASIYIGKKQ